MNYSLQPVPVTYVPPTEIPISPMPVNPPVLEMPQVNPVQPVQVAVPPINPVEVVKPLPTYVPQQTIRKEEEFEIMNSSSRRSYDGIPYGTSVLCQNKRS